MTEGPAPAAAAELVELRDGTRVVVRPIAPGDKEALTAAFERLGPESRYRRFFSAVQGLTAVQLAYFTEVDHRDHEALVTVDAETDEVLAVARFVRLEHEHDGAEMAIVVADDRQGLGIGTELLGRLARRAREEGIERWVATTLSTNHEIADLLAQVGTITGRSQQGGGVVELRIELPDRRVRESPLHDALRLAARGELDGVARGLAAAAGRVAQDGLDAGRAAASTGIDAGRAAASTGLDAGRAAARRTPRG